MTRVVHPRAWEMRSVEASIESMRSSFKRLGIPETDVKVTWDAEALWARLRMRLPVTATFVEHLDTYDDTRHPRHDVRDLLWTLARWLDERSRRVKRGENISAVFAPAAAEGGSDVNAPLTDEDLNTAAALERSEALKKFRRGSPLVFADACAFWKVTKARGATAPARLDATEVLLKRALEGWDTAPKGRLPSLSTCYGLLNLHRLMASRFAAEVNALAAGGSK